MKLHKEGHKSLKIVIIIIILLLYLSIIINSGVIDFLLITMLIILVITLNFFRIPKRKFERKDGVIYSPCDGKIVVIEETTENEFYKDSRIQVSIFMSPLDVHNQLYPINGRIKYKKYHAGKSLFAWHPKASNENERCTIVINNKKITLLIRQIAGALAKRIITYPEEGDEIKCSDELGFIKFGSRVDLLLPTGTKIEIALNQKVIGGKSIIGTY